MLLKVYRVQLLLLRDSENKERSYKEGILYKSSKFSKQSKLFKLGESLQGT